MQFVEQVAEYSTAPTDLLWDGPHLLVVTADAQLHVHSIDAMHFSVTAAATTTVSDKTVAAEEKNAAMEDDVAAAAEEKSMQTPGNEETTTLLKECIGLLGAGKQTGHNRKDGLNVFFLCLTG